MSRIVLDKPMEIHGFRIAALSRVRFHAQVSAHHAAGFGQKEPLALLLAGPGGTRACSPEGRAMSQAEIEALLPGVWETLGAPLAGENS